MMQAIADFIQELSGATSLRGVSDALDGHVRDLGFDRYCYHVIRPPEGPRAPFYLGSYPDDWSLRYLENDYVNVDPVIAAVPERLSPFRWDYLYASCRRNPQQRRVLEEADDFGLPRGITIPLHGPDRAIADFSVASGAPPRTFEQLWRQHYYDLHLLGLYAHQAIVQQFLTHQSDHLLHLAPRERECLLWTSRGKTAWEVAEILGISRETATHYLKTAAQKLGVYSKTHAVVKAIVLGLIVP